MSFPKNRFNRKDERNQDSQNQDNHSKVDQRKARHDLLPGVFALRDCITQIGGCSEVLHERHDVFQLGLSSLRGHPELDDARCYIGNTRRRGNTRIVGANRLQRRHLDHVPELFDLVPVRIGMLFDQREVAVGVNRRLLLPIGNILTGGGAHCSLGQESLVHGDCFTVRENDVCLS